MQALTIYGDGGSRGNPGQAAYGFVICSPDGEVIYEQGKAIGITTNNVAEYMAVIESLKHVKNNYRENLSSIHFRLDSQLVVRQLTGIYKVKNEAIRELFFTATRLISELNVPISFEHIPREQNFRADAQVNRALDALR